MYFISFLFASAVVLPFSPISISFAVALCSLVQRSQHDMNLCAVTAYGPAFVCKQLCKWTFSYSKFKPIQYSTAFFFSRDTFSIDVVFGLFYLGMNTKAADARNALRQPLIWLQIVNSVANNKADDSSAIVCTYINEQLCSFQGPDAENKKNTQGQWNFLKQTRSEAEKKNPLTLNGSTTCNVKPHGTVTQMFICWLHFRHSPLPYLLHNYLHVSMTNTPKNLQVNKQENNWNVSLPATK